MKTEYDKIIIGAGLYGMYSALFCGQRGQKILLLECEQEPFRRATYRNQARVHQGYHYPRSISTAMKSARYFERFHREYSFCIHKEFKKIYATSSQYSWTNGKQFKKFCHAAGIPCEEVYPETFFKKGMCDGAFLTREYTYDAKLLKKYFQEQLKQYDNVVIRYRTTIKAIEKEGNSYVITADENESWKTGFVLNAAYSGTNQILEIVGYEKFPIKYELCELILCQAGNKLLEYGFTVMDGPFFSIMPFGKTGMHSLTSVTFTPHMTSYSKLPEFSCQKEVMEYCSSLHLGNCSDCRARPDTKFPYMERLARKYLRDEYEFRYTDSLFSIKPILMSSEVDDSRPTIIRIHSESPAFVSVLSGKINTVYDLDEVLQ